MSGKGSSVMKRVSLGHCRADPWVGLAGASPGPTSIAASEVEGLLNVNFLLDITIRAC
jgi:hypothetical protein